MALPACIQIAGFTPCRPEQRHDVSSAQKSGSGAPAPKAHRQDQAVTWAMSRARQSMSTGLERYALMPSNIGRKGCVVGDDANWNYLYSDETGLTKTGLGWVDSYMYDAHSIHAVKGKKHYIKYNTDQNYATEDTSWTSPKN